MCQQHLHSRPHAPAACAPPLAPAAGCGAPAAAGGGVMAAQQPWRIELQTLVTLLLYCYINMKGRSSSHGFSWLAMGVPCSATAERSGCRRCNAVPASAPVYHCAGSTQTFETSTQRVLWASSVSAAPRWQPRSSPAKPACARSLGWRDLAAAAQVGPASGGAGSLAGVLLANSSNAVFNRAM